MKFDDLFQYIGEIGTYQVCLFLNIVLVAFWGAEAIAMNFIGASMDHWCKVDELQQLPHDDQRHVAIPQDKVTVQGYASCDVYNLNYSQYTTEEFLTWNRSVMVDETTGIDECDAWVYDQSEFVSTIQSEWDLVCGDEWKIPMSSTIYMAGFMVGAITTGFVSDKIGRRLTLWICVFAKICGGFVATYAPELISFCCGRFILGFGSAGTYLVGFVIVMETVGSTWRTIFGLLYLSGYSLGYMLLPWIAYNVRDHVTLQLVLTIPNMIFLSYIWIIPESPRWLLVNERYDEAVKVIKFIADINNTELPEAVYIEVKNLKKNVVETREGSCFDLMRYSRLRIRTLIICFHWFSCNLMYFGFSLNSGTLAGSVFTNTFIAGAVEIPANLLCIVCMNWSVMGRRWTCGLSLVLTGVSAFCMIPFIVYGIDAGVTTFSMVGKAFTTMAASGINIFACELFPTEVRNVGIGSGSMCAYLAAMAAPFMGPVLASVWMPLPSLIFGICGTVSGTLTILFLPETMGEGMLETIQEADAFRGRSKKVAEDKEEERPLLGHDRE